MSKLQKKNNKVEEEIEEPIDGIEDDLLELDGEDSDDDDLEDYELQKKEKEYIEKHTSKKKHSDEDDED